jgi:pimeloyl-ACP methyl ester carboxylesterase
MKKVIALFMFLTVMVPSYVLAYEVVVQDVMIDGIFEHTQTIISASEDPIDRFTIHRYRNKYTCPNKTKRAMILVPGLQSRFDMYLDGFAQAVALTGVEVWGYSPRAANLTSNCEVDPTSCMVSGTWGMDEYVNDIMYLRSFMDGIVPPDAKVAMGGVSLGAMVPVAVVNIDPDRYDGLFLLDGFVYSEDPEVINHNTPFCGMLSAMVDAGVYYDGTQGEVSTLLMILDQSDPDGNSPIISGLTNKQAFVAFFDTLPPEAPVSGHPNASICKGDVTDGEFYYADREKLYYGIETFIPYIPLVITRDFVCAIAGQISYADNLSNYTGSIYAGGGTEGFGGHMEDELNLFTNANVVENFDTGYGHMDTYFSKTRFRDLILPFMGWLYSL